MIVQKELMKVIRENILELKPWYFASQDIVYSVIMIGINKEIIHVINEKEYILRVFAIGEIINVIEF